MSSKKVYSVYDDLHILNRVALDKPEYPMGNRYWIDLCDTNPLFAGSWQAFRERFTKKIFCRWRDFKNGLTDECQEYFSAVEEKLIKQRKSKQKRAQHGKVKTTLIPRSCSSDIKTSPTKKNVKVELAPVKIEATIPEEKEIDDLEVKKVETKLPKITHSTELYQQGSFDDDYAEKPTVSSRTEEYLVKKSCDTGIHYELKYFQSVEYITATQKNSNCIFCK